MIGVANRGKDNLDGVAHENIVALCDVDARYLETAGARFGDAKRFADFRELLPLPNLDAVVVSTPTTPTLQQRRWRCAAASTSTARSR